MRNNAQVYVLDDEPMSCQILVRLLNSVDLPSNVFYSPMTFLDEYNPDRTFPSCLLLDIRMPDFSGLQLHEMLNEKQPTIPVIFITGHADISCVVRVMKSGAFDFFTKPFNPHLLLDSIYKAIDVDQKNLKMKAEKERFNCLTLQEKQILDLLIEGASSKSIANQTNLSYKTIEYHRAKIMNKLNAKNMGQLFSTYYRYLGK